MLLEEENKGKEFFTIKGSEQILVLIFVAKKSVIILVNITETIKIQVFFSHLHYSYSYDNANFKKKNNKL